MLVLLNGGGHSSAARWYRPGCHSLMLVLLNGGYNRQRQKPKEPCVPLADACVTEWRTRSTGCGHLSGFCATR